MFEILEGLTIIQGVILLVVVCLLAWGGGTLLARVFPDHDDDDESREGECDDWYDPNARKVQECEKNLLSRYGEIVARYQPGTDGFRVAFSELKYAFNAYYGFETVTSVCTKKGL